MNERITARELFDQLQERLELRWLGPHEDAGQRAIESGERLSRRPSLAGYLNTIYPNRVQILGTEELKWLDGMDARQRWETLQKIVNFKPLALVLTRNQGAPSDLRDAAEESGIALWTSPRRGHELLTLFQYHLARALAPRITMHGVFMEVYSIGVLITGDSGSGKSELALELVSRGHRLVADDAPEFTQIAPDVLDGTCPELLQDLLEVRGLGILNIRDMFGHTAVKRNKYLRLIVHLDPVGEDNGADIDRLSGDTSQRQVLDLEIPCITLPVAPGRNLAVLLEAAVRVYILRAKGIDPAHAFLARHSQMLQDGGASY
ncbi:MAG: HPr(Ser) kinase/phosphatase [Lysobacteraceae bacterium]